MKEPAQFKNLLATDILSVACEHFIDVLIANRTRGDIDYIAGQFSNPTADLLDFHVLGPTAIALAKRLYLDWGPRNVNVKIADTANIDMAFLNGLRVEGANPLSAVPLPPIDEDMRAGILALLSDRLGIAPTDTETPMMIAAGLESVVSTLGQGPHGIARLEATPSFPLAIAPPSGASKHKFNAFLLVDFLSRRFVSLSVTTALALDSDAAAEVPKRKRKFQDDGVSVSDL
jgi:hypothetical protein